MSTWTFSHTFAQEFQTCRTGLEARIAAAQISPSVSQELLQDLSAELAKLVKNLVDATGSLPSYDQRQYEEQLKALEKALSDLRTKWVPKTKFTFKRKAGAAPSTNTPINGRPEAKATKSPTPQSDTTHLSISSHSHRFLTAESLSITTVQHSLTISDLTHCILDLIPRSTSAHGGSDVCPSMFNISALHIRNLTDTVLILPPINGSALIHDLSRCTIVLGCHQFRMHTSRNVDVYISITSNPIIEDSAEIRFSGYPSGLQSQSGDNQHISVLDFSHIRPTPSPNWSILADDQIKTQWTSLDDQENLDSVRERFLPR